MRASPRTGVLQARSSIRSLRARVNQDLTELFRMRHVVVLIGYHTAQDWSDADRRIAPIIVVVFGGKPSSDSARFKRESPRPLA